MKEITVLSLFDGMSCGQIALKELGVKVKYFAAEIDKHAIAVTQHNFPETTQLGDVTKVFAKDLPKIDIILGGSPCQSFSFAGKRKGMSTKCETEILTLDHYLELKAEGYEFEGQSYLFWEYMRLLNEVKPKYFLLENVMMGEKWEKVLSKAIGINAMPINSALVSAQNRKRLYWFGQIKERLFYNDNYCYICRHEQENGGIQNKAQTERVCEILGEAQERQVNLQNLRIGISENRKEGSNKNLFCYMPREKQKIVRQEQVQNKEKHLSERISQKEQRKAFGVSKELSKNYEGEGNVSKDGKEPIKKNSKKNENSSSSGVNWSKEEAEQRRVDYYSKYGEDMCCVQCGKRLNHRPQTSFVEGWNKLLRKSPSTLSEVQFNEARQNNGRVFDILEIGVIGEDMFGEVINQIPQPKDKGILLKDILETEVESKYFLKDEVVQKLNQHRDRHKEQGHGFGAIYHNENQKMQSLKVGGKGIDDLVIVASRGCNPENPSVQKDNLVMQINPSTESNGCQPFQQNRIYSAEGISPALQAQLSTGLNNIFIPEDMVQAADFRNDEGIRVRTNGKAPTLTSGSKNSGTQLNSLAIIKGKIRRLTPTECQRLQTVPSWYDMTIASDTQKYRMLGNGWTIEVIKHILSFI